MSEHIHRNGDRYRIWYTIPDGYGTAPLTREEMTARLVAEGQRSAEVEERLARADRNGTSAYSVVGDDENGWRVSRTVEREALR